MKGVKLFLEKICAKIKNNGMIVDEITHKIIGCCMQVHNTFGNGFQEIIYQRALEIEMRYSSLEFSRELEMPIFYRG